MKKIIFALFFGLLFISCSNSITSPTEEVEDPQIFTCSKVILIDNSGAYIDAEELYGVVYTIYTVSTHTAEVYAEFSPVLVNELELNLQDSILNADGQVVNCHGLYINYDKTKN